MRPIKLDGFTIPARRIAELEWGKGGTTAYRTNRRGAYYYSCSGHGGYVVDSRCLTAQERRRIDRYTRPLPLRLLVQRRNGAEVVIGVNCVHFQSCGPYRQKSYRYGPSLGPVDWQDLPVYTFEEDCEWAILEKLTDIVRVDDLRMSERKRRGMANRTFKHWVKPIGQRED